ncbi:MAG: phage tail assembly protein [Allorhizobium sp.]
MTTITLSSPVEHAGVTYTSLKFREATVGDLIAGSQFVGDLSQSVAVLASISEVPLPAFKKITASDLAAIIAATGDILGNGPAVATGT